MPVASITFSGGGFRNIDIAAGAGIAAEKVIQQYTVSRLITADAATAVAAIEIPLTIIDAPTASLMSFVASLDTAITAASDRTITVDLKKSTAGGAYATVLSSTIGFDESDTARVALPAVISSANAIAGDMYKVVVTVAGSTGTQGKGLLVSLTIQDRLA